MNKSSLNHFKIVPYVMKKLTAIFSSEMYSGIPYPHINKIGPDIGKNTSKIIVCGRQNGLILNPL